MYLWSRGEISTIVYFTHLRVIFWKKKILRKVRQGWAIFKSPYSLYLQVISQMHFQIIIFFILVSAAGISCVERKMQANICQTMHQYLGNLPLKKKISHKYKISNQGVVFGMIVYIKTFFRLKCFFASSMSNVISMPCACFLPKE